MHFTSRKSAKSKLITVIFALKMILILRQISTDWFQFWKKLPFLDMNNCGIDCITLSWLWLCITVDKSLNVKSPPNVKVDFLFSGPARTVTAHKWDHQQPSFCQCLCWTPCGASTAWWRGDRSIPRTRAGRTGCTLRAKPGTWCPRGTTFLSTPVWTTQTTPTTWS